MPWEPAVAGFGIAAAFLIVGGAVVLRYQRDRHHFLLAKAAIERGTTAFPGQLPAWLVSLRVGVMVLALGLGLMVAGGIMYNSAENVAQPTEAPPAPPRPPASMNAATAPANPVPPPPPAHPGEMERWHRSQNQHVGGLAAVCAGAILTLLGLVRIVFAGFERKYSAGVDRSAT